MSEIVVAGSFVQDLAFKTSQFPNVGETRIGTFFQGPGGKGFNQAVAAARVGGDTLFIGALGDDVFAESAGKFAAGVGLKTLFQEVEGESTGAASIIVNAKGDNQIVVALGANGVLSPKFVEEAQSEIAKSKVVLCQLEANLSAMEKTLQIGADSGSVTILNVAPINESFDPDVLKYTTIITPNETEFSYVYEKATGKKLDGDYFQAPEAELHALCRELGVPVVVITLGEAGAFLSVDGGELPGDLNLSGQCYLTVPPIEAKVVDTTGAGDAFSGGFAAGLVRYEGDLAMALKFAGTVAGLSVEKAGTAPSMPTEAEVLQRL